MSAFLTKTKEQLVLYWIVGIYLFFFTIVSLVFAIVGALYGFTWHEAGGQDKFIIICLIIGNWGTTMMAFLNRAASRVSKGELPIDAGDERGTRTVEQKTVIESKSVSTTPPKPVDSEPHKD